MVDETKICSNCKRDISEANFVMHEMHCRRHIVLCENCDEPVHRSELEQHFSDLHAKVPCEKCQKLVPKSDMVKHVEEECTKKLMRCEYCELTLPKSELEEHIDYCGSRTECCPLCKQYIMQKDKLRHEHSRCTYPEPKPQPVDPFSMGDLQFMLSNAVLGAQTAAGSNNRHTKAANNRKSELNAQRAKNITVPDIQEDGANPTLVSDTSYDKMLAYQLSHQDSWFLDGQVDADSDEFGPLPPYFGDTSPGLEDFENFLSNGVESWSSLVQPFEFEVPAPNNDTHDDDDDEMTIPCEFCEVKVPLSLYMAHTDSCLVATQRQVTDLNNEQAQTQATVTRATIPVINNLQASSSVQEYRTTEEDEDIMLPCEFCEEIFPSDVIFQHQSVCQADALTTPRTGTPIRSYENHRSPQPATQNSFKPPSNSSPRRRQIGQANGDGFVIGDQSSSSRPQKPNESSSDKYSPAYSRFNEAVTRPPRRASQKPNQGNINGQEVKRKSKNSQRVRATLNQFLQDDTGSETVGSINMTKPLSPSASNDINKSDPREVKTKVPSRAMLRRTEEARAPPAQTSHNRRTQTQNTSQAANNSSQLQSPAAAARNRQQNDHVFSPDLRLKPEHNPPPKKR